MKILDKEGLHNLDFNISKDKVTAWQATMLNKVEEEIPSVSDIDKAGDIELQEIAKSMENLIFQIKTFRQIQMIYSNILCENFYVQAPNSEAFKVL